MFGKLRLTLLVYILVLVAGSAWLTRARTTDWDRPLNIVIYPVNGDGSDITRQYIQELHSDTFDGIEKFFNREAERHGLALKTPVDISLSTEIKELPPLPEANATTLSIVYWSLKLRYWAWRHDNYPYPKNIRIFIPYYDPGMRQSVAHSLGLKEGLIGIVNAFSSKSQADNNSVIIAHEILHTVGATDKYNPLNSQPLYPDGYADPDLQPLHPQTQAEIMGGRVPVTGNQAEIPASLKIVVIGNATAREIHWIE